MNPTQQARAIASGDVAPFGRLKGVAVRGRVVSLRRFLAGPVTFGLTLGFAVVALMLHEWAWQSFGAVTLAAWGAALALAAIAVKLGWPVFHVGATGALLVAAGSLVGTRLWALPLAAGVGAMGMARFASVGLASRWLSRLVGLMGVAGIAWMAYGVVSGGPAWAAFGGWEVAVGGFALAVIAALGLWHASGEDE